MYNYCLIVQYDGTDYAGFQIQPNQPTVQGELEKALAQLSGTPIKVVGAGRTDSGVHSEGQTISFCSDRLTVPIERLPYAMNRLLSRDIRIVKSKLVDISFHARRSAIDKTYRYQIYEGEFPNVFLRRYSYWSREKLDWQTIEKCAQLFVGRIDFASFAASGSSAKTSVRTMSKVEVNCQGSLKTISFTADGFLYNMVRNLVGTLVDVGKGKLSLEDVQSILHGRDRSLASATIAPHGLFFESVRYS